ncbi:MAG TPA: methylmalonyl Co-A mutase-associated GTPase MeaB [Thermoplasmata archaeon]|nr:methylmalonyl Co-A mutase-associated GTPase MeaB [Thermoplasmata archaeon]
MTRPPTPTPLAARRVLRGDRQALARLISQVENRDPSALPAVRALYPHSGRATVVGVTGPLGVGKSSLLNLLLAHLRAQGKRVGIVAVDPSSPFSGGSILGDRIRLERPPGDDGVFIRSMASRGHAGGVALATRETVRLLDAFGMEVILVETVGSGQSDVEIRDVASTSVVVVVPHLGDEVQSLKAGLFEIADVFCVNKSDLPGADSAARYLTEMTQLIAAKGAWQPSVVRTSTTLPSGVPELWTAIERHEAFLDADGSRRTRDRQRLTDEILGLVRERVDRQLASALGREPDLQALLDRVVAREIDPHSAADRLLAEVRRSR